MAKVLCIGMDAAAMQTRKLILEKAGHNVTQASDLRQVTSACERILFDIAILGHSLNPNEKKRITGVVQTYSRSTRILELHTGTAAELPDADTHLQFSASEPKNLMQAVNTLLRMPRRQKAWRAKP
jgi:hypothetical protein